MVFLLFVLAIAMIATGLAAMLFGMSIVQVERGWTMVISGTVGATGGALLLGIAIMVMRIGRVVNEMVWVRDRLATIGEITAEETAGWSEETDADADPEPALAQASNPAGAPPVPPGLDAAPEPVLPPAERVIVGQYASGGNEYKMYSDGSIDATTPAGLRRFSSLEELRAFVAGGGERAN